MNPALMAITVSGLLFVGMLVFIDIGYRIGRNRKRNVPGTSDEGVSTVDAAVFGLLGLILAFTFSGASSRLDVRRAQIVQESNAIGTAYLRVDLLPASDQPALRDLFRQYLETRIEMYEKIADFDAAKGALDNATKLQNEIWSNSVKGCQSDPNPRVCTLVLPALNEMIDITNTRTMAMYTHAPTVILVLLIVLSLLGALLSGFAMSAQAKRSLLHTVMFALAISISIYTVLDLEYPRFGLINLSSHDRAITQLRDTIK
jgi:hypothetical protein